MADRILQGLKKATINNINEDYDNMSMSDNDPSFAEKVKEKTTKTNTAAPGEIPPEVFDSSTSDSMTDLKASATMNGSEVHKVLSDTENKEPIEPEAVPIETTTTNANIPPPPHINTTVTPTPEGHASAQKKSNENESENKSISKQLDKQTTQINKKIAQIVQPLQKHIKSVDRQSKLIKQLQSQLKQLQKQVSQVQRGINIGKKKQK
jgi:hypothetical protein